MQIVGKFERNTRIVLKSNWLFLDALKKFVWQYHVNWSVIVLADATKYTITEVVNFGERKQI